MSLFSRLFGPRKTAAPTLGLLDLSFGSAGELVAADKAALGALFSAVVEAVGAPPQCSVLLLYCTFAPDGRIEGSSLQLRDIIRASGAPIAVVATQNPAESYMAAAPQSPYGRANLVLTLNRRGAAFGRFFAALFADMKHGTTMPMAWVRLAPQIPGGSHPECPDTIFACELGQVRLWQS